MPEVVSYRTGQSRGGESSRTFLGEMLTFFINRELFHSSTPNPKTNLFSVFANGVTGLLAGVLTLSENASPQTQKQEVTTPAKRLEFCVGKVDIREPYRTFAGTGGFGRSG